MAGRLEIQLGGGAMKKIISSISVVALCLGTIAMIPSAGAREQKAKPGTTPPITSALYRNATYERKLAAEHGGNRDVPSGRWARLGHRRAFATGFEQGCGTCHGAVAR